MFLFCIFNLLTWSKNRRMSLSNCCSDASTFFIENLQQLKHDTFAALVRDDFGPAHNELVKSLNFENLNSLNFENLNCSLFGRG